MKPLKLTKIAIALAALVAATSAHGDEDNLQGTTANLTLKLTEYLTDPSLLLKDENGKVDPEKIPTFSNEYSVVDSKKSVETYEYGSKIVTYKISNKEFLEALRYEEGLIDDIKGWSLVLLEVDGDNTAFITKKDTAPINVSQYLSLLWKDAAAEKESYQYVDTEVFATGSFSVKETGSFQAKYLVGIQSQFSSTKLDLQGVYSESAILKTYGKGEEQYTQWMPGSRSVTSISGALLFDEDDDFEDDDDDAQDPSVITGSISIAAGKQIDLSAFSGL